MRILIVEDSETASKLLSTYLKKAGHTTRRVATGEEALQVLDIDSVDLILLDIAMAGLNGYETARIIRETFPDHWLPIIFVTADEDHDSFKKAIEAGGDDYLVKPISETLLNSKVAAMSRLLAQHEELNSTNQALKLSSQMDQLTGLYNRTEALRQANVAWLKMQSTNSPIAALMIDIDHFKQFNDSFGHLKGDDCLKAVASCLRECVAAEGGILGRFGGEEFICVLAETDTHEAARFSKSLIAALNKLRIDYPGSPLGYVSVSVGCAACSMVNRYELQDLIRHADSVLYEAKENGRNQVCWDDFPTSHKLFTDETEFLDTTKINPEPKAAPNATAAGTPKSAPEPTTTDSNEPEPLEPEAPDNQTIEPPAEPCENVSNTATALQAEPTASVTPSSKIYIILGISIGFGALIAIGLNFLA